jgi:hypothetical protein
MQVSEDRELLIGRDDLNFNRIASAGGAGPRLSKHSSLVGRFPYASSLSS